MASWVPSGAKYAGGTRGAKNPGTPNVAVAMALTRFSSNRNGLSDGGTVSGIPDDNRSQKALRRGMRSSTRLPAMIAAFIAPMETPATQSGA